MRKRTAIVHIGLEKTGSTAIQRWLVANQGSLQTGGVLMPHSLGYPNHTKLVSACLDYGVVDNIKSHHLFATGLSEEHFRSRVFTNLARELKQAGQSWHTLLITSELISSRLCSAAEINRLAAVVGQYVDHIQFVIFLRRQDQLALSRFSSILRSGYGGFADIYVDYSPFNFQCLCDQRLVNDDLFFYDFEAILARFEGLSNSELEVFFYGSDRPVETFARLLNLDEGSNQQAQGHHNSALSAKAQFVLAQLNQRYPVQFSSGMRNDAYRHLQRQIEREVSGPPRTISRQSAVDFLAHYREANQRVLSRYARHSTQGFSDDFSAYPEVVDYSELPSLAKEHLSHYRALAQQVPTAEPLADRLRFKLRRLTTRAKSFAATSLR
jgi:hypothetical protein